ncbi:F-box/LRR-repeat protein 8-like [Anolis sagrei]|uniref:F-box/LRR-repeat protein 8-like n=1 Tax=Anolis sagrei TaxID=38937 RepID=UPI00351FCB44
MWRASQFASLLETTGATWRWDHSFEEDPLEMIHDMVVRSLPYMKHIKSLKILVDQSQEVNRKSTCDLFVVLAQMKCQLQALRVVCITPFFYSGLDILQSIRKFCQQMSMGTLQVIDLKQMPFALDNVMVGLIAVSSPDLRTFLINNHAMGFIMVRPETIVDILGICPNLSTLGVTYMSLSVTVFKAMLDPKRPPFKYLDIYCSSILPHIPNEVWPAMLQRNPCFRVGLEFATEVHPTRLALILNPFIPMAALRFNGFSCLVDHLTLAAQHYSQTLEVLELSTAASSNLDAVLIELAKRCANLREVHCNCPVSLEVKKTFLSHCPKLRKYTLLTAGPFFNTFPTVYL